MLREKGKLLLLFHLTCVVKDGVFDGAVLKEGVCRLDVLKVTVLKQGVLELDGFYLDVGKPESCAKKFTSAPPASRGADRRRPDRPMRRTCRECTPPRGGPD